MRITFVLPYAGTAGGTRVVATYAQRLKQRGHQVVVMSTPRRDPGLRVKVSSLLSGNGWPARRGPSHMDRVDVEHRVIDRWRPMTDADLPDADVVVATWWETAEWVARLGPAKGAKVYFIQHDESLFAPPPERVRATWSLPLHKITIAQWLVDLAKARGDADVDLVPNSVDLELFHAPPREKGRVPTIGTMYSDAPFKGVEVAIKAVQLARTPGLRLVAFGAAAPAKPLPSPPMAQYFLEPPQDQIRGIYASCDAWLFASRAEGFGLPILEAMACRTPVIATPAGAAPELVGSGGGILVPIDDPTEMARAIDRVCGMSPPEWRAMSNAALATATRYTWDEATDRFEAALKRVVEKLDRAPITSATTATATAAQTRR